MEKHSLSVALLGSRGSRKKNSIKDGKIVGFLGHPDTGDHLLLIALTMNISKSELLRSIVDEFLKKQHSIAGFVSQTHALWAQSDHMKFGDFTARVRKFLLEKGLSRKFVEEVIKGLNKY